VKNKKEHIILVRAKPSESAAKFRELVHPTLIWVEEDWLVYEGGAYTLIKDNAMRARIRRFLLTAKVIVVKKNPETGDLEESVAPFNPKKNDVNEVYVALEDGCHREVTPMSWLDGNPVDQLNEPIHPDPANIISLKNGLLDVTTCVLHPHTSEFFTRTTLPIRFEATPDKPKQFFKFLREITSAADDKELKGRQAQIDLIREMIGLLICADAEFEVVFYLLGKSRGGKGTLMKIIKALVGQRNLAAPTIRSFAGDFWAWGLMDKSVAMVTDMAISDREAIKLAANHINMLSGRDPVDVNRKFKDPIMACTLPTRVLMAGNAMPDFGDHAEALANRLLIILFEQSFKHCMDTGLARRIIATELPAILFWALKGLKDLRARGHFVEPAESVKAKRVLMHLANPVRGFVEDMCVVGAGSANKAKVYSVYQNWCHECGIKNVLSLANFSLRLYEAVPGCHDYRPRINGEQVPCYFNVSLKSGEPNSDDFGFDVFAHIRDSLDMGLTPEQAIEDAKLAHAQAETGM